ncbi:MAG TPA: hypothetical protein VKY73_06390 [Polyangiaceae bacterium]|nr:hypothetical protein [Polyangiaceae bacterium]
MVNGSPPAERALGRRFEPVLYAFVAGAVTLFVALKFYGSLRLQTLHALHWAHPERFDELVRAGRLGPWSAPLDDVFIHFDFARSAARGAPFEWVPGNGYSSGGTSFLYPFVLAVGYWLGFRGLDLMEWAAILACVCTFAVLLGARQLTRDLPRAASYVLPFGFLSVGALDWSLFSGMEVALLLALWAAALIAYGTLVERLRDPAPVRHAELAPLAAACVLVVATRPEAVVAVVVFAAGVALALLRRGPRPALVAAFLVGLPSALFIVGQSLTNLVMTGDSTAAGALVKLEAHHPYLTRREVLDAWFFHLKYQILRVTHYHFADTAIYGWLVWVFAGAALFERRTRKPAALLLATAALWVLLVAGNGQVRWQNERYTMPAVAWLLLAASLGVAALLVRAVELRARIRGPLVLAATVTGVALFVIHQAPRFREQVWFFGRASRNIYDQHVRTGSLLRQMQPPPERVLLGDAGAIPYVSDRPALDIIGLGGFAGLPFARATRHHVGAGIELVERLAPELRPDLLALYPGWWGDFPLWFGRKVGEVPVRGNVICGGASKVLYLPDWSPLDESARPFSLRAGERVIAEVDPADMVSEREHHYAVHGAPGFVAMKLLPSPESGRPLWDAGRVVPAGASESFVVSGLTPGRPTRLLVRLAPTNATRFSVTVDGRPAGAIRVEAKDAWVEAALSGLVIDAPRAEVRFEAGDGERVVYHVFLVQE